MARKYLPAVIFSAAALSGIGYGLKQVIDFLTTLSPSSGIEQVVTEHPSPKNILSVEPYPLKQTQRRNALTKSVTLDTRPEPPPERTREDFWSSYFQQNGTYIPNPEGETTFEFKSDCTNQCIYLQDEKKGYIRYELSSGEQFSLRISMRYYQIQYCDEDYESCGTAEFTLNQTFLVIDKDGDLVEFGKTIYNHSDRNQEAYIQRIPDFEEP